MHHIKWKTTVKQALFFFIISVFLLFFGFADQESLPRGTSLTALAKAPMTASGSLKNAKKAPGLSGRFVTRKGQKYFRLAGGDYAKNTWIKYRGKYYYLDLQGQMYRGWLVYNGRRYFLSKKGPMLMGWQKISGSWYYFNSNGTLNTSLKPSQYVLVRSSGYKAKVYLICQASKGRWTQLVGTNGYVGRLGVGKKPGEGVAVTPKGTYTLGRAFGVRPDPGTVFSYTQVDSSHYWVDDPSSMYYNQFVSTQSVQRDWNSAEHLADYPEAYAYALSVNFNTDCVPGKGSAIFLHCSTGGPTAGCIAVPKSSMIKILRLIQKDARIHIS